MIDFAWSEFFVVILVAVLVIGPKQLPEVLHAVGRIVRRLQYMKFALSKQFDDFMEQSDLKELRDQGHQMRQISVDALSEAEADEPAEVQISEKKEKPKDVNQGDLLG